MIVINVNGYDNDEKVVLASGYIIPEILKQYNLNKGDIIFSNELLRHIINNIEKEDGVRNLKRCLEIIHTKLNLYRLMKPETNLFEQDMSLKVTFPFKITKNCVDKLIKQKDENVFLKHLYV
jgi:ATP-dependent Lon protease